MGKIIIANWKMNPKSIKEARGILKETLKEIKQTKGIEVVICLPFPFLSIVNGLKSKKITFGAQNIFPEPKGAFTGEVSLPMIQSLGAKYVILGHSERRKLGETNKIINKKVLATLKAKLTPILCIGESKRDEDGFYLAFLKHQLIECLTHVPRTQIKNIIIAYEPLWAIGGKARHIATEDEFTEIQIFIKKVISDLYDIKIASSIRVAYGGSVHPLNADNFILGGADGLLIGRDSLKPKKFGKIIRSIE